MNASNIEVPILETLSTRKTIEGPNTIKSTSGASEHDQAAFAADVMAEAVLAPHNSHLDTSETYCGGSAAKNYAQSSPSTATYATMDNVCDKASSMSPENTTRKTTSSEDRCSTPCVTVSRSGSLGDIQLPCIELSPVIVYAEAAQTAPSGELSCKSALATLSGLQNIRDNKDSASKQHLSTPCERNHNNPTQRANLASAFQCNHCALVLSTEGQLK